MSTTTNNKNFKYGCSVFSQNFTVNTVKQSLVFFLFSRKLAANHGTADLPVLAVSGCLAVLPCLARSSSSATNPLWGCYWLAPQLSQEEQALWLSTESSLNVFINWARRYNTSEQPEVKTHKVKLCRKRSQRAPAAPLGETVSFLLAQKHVSFEYTRAETAPSFLICWKGLSMEGLKYLYRAQAVP